MNLRLPRYSLWLGIGALLTACSAAPAANDSRVEPRVIAAAATSAPIVSIPTVMPPTPTPAPAPSATATPPLPTAPPPPPPPPTLPPAPASDFGPAPEIETAVWLNTEQPLRLADLRGKVVLVDFWTFG